MQSPTVFTSCAYCTRRRIDRPSYIRIALSQALYKVQVLVARQRLDFWGARLVWWWLIGNSGIFSFSFFFSSRQPLVS